MPVVLVVFFYICQGTSGSITSTWKSWEKNKGNMHIYVVQFGFLFYICGVASYWMINLFTWPTVSTYKREKRRELKLSQNKTKHVNIENLKPVISNPGVQL